MNNFPNLNPSSLPEPGLTDAPSPSVEPQLSSTPSDITPRFPTWVDSSALATFKACDRKGYWGNVMRLTSHIQNPHFNAGGAYAKAQEVTRDLIYGPRRVPTQDAVAKGVLTLIREYGDFDPSDDAPHSAKAKTWLGMCDAFIRYYQRWSPEMDWFMPDMHPREYNDSVALLPSTEFSFAIPLPIDHPVTGDPILFTGRADMTVRLGGQGCWMEFQKSPHKYMLDQWPKYIFDDKTTWQMGKTWAKQWSYRGQFMGYVWANNQLAHEEHEKAVGAIVAGAGIQKTLTKNDRAIVDFPQWKIDDWYDTTMYVLERMIKCWHDNKWAKQWDDSCIAFGGCEYSALCDTPRPEVWFHNFTENPWNPVPSPSKED